MSVRQSIPRTSASFIFQPPDRLVMGPDCMIPLNPISVSTFFTSATCSTRMCLIVSITNSTTFIFDCAPWMSVSTKMVRSSSAGGKPSIL